MSTRRRAPDRVAEVVACFRSMMAKTHECDHALIEVAEWLLAAAEGQSSHHEWSEATQVLLDPKRQPVTPGKVCVMSPFGGWLALVRLHAGLIVDDVPREKRKTSAGPRRFADALRKILVELRARAVTAGGGVA